jgi:hypothetical protein
VGRPAPRLALYEPQPGGARPRQSGVDAAITVADPTLLVAKDDASCVKGCYRCLLSYFNQPDHELIDRTDDVVRRLLLRLARSQVARAQPKASEEPPSEWHAAMARWGLPAPDNEPLKVNGAVLPIAWHAHRAAAAIGAVDEKTRAGAEALGYAITVLPEAPGESPPPELVELLGASA